MAEEPVPTSEQESHPPATVTGTAEDRKAAAALENLSSREDLGDEAAGEGTAADTAALGAAVSNLSIKEEADGKKKVKVEAADVTFLVQELEVSKGKATEMLKSHEGNRMAAIKAFVVPSVKA